MSEKQEKLTIEEYNLYLKAAIKNLGGGNALYENLSSELNRLAKLYTIEEVKKKIWVLEMKKVGSIPTFCLSLIPLLSGGFF
ncbi:hypothetical protein [Enterococcus cecorum]|uniref:Uncharacterized protein n=1 Tax=Enterococcus cecorum TaxID=44008 RepID=A0A366SKC5_9ENTE|nr:hypothetical protein [Enterococcus cecorum]RBR31670.1 hypothetical protein EB18_00092 [Enterococcus cecorum]